MDNANSPEYLEKIKNQVIENLRRTGAPSVQMTSVPRDPLMPDMDDAASDAADDEDEDEHKDERYTQRRWDKATARDDEFEDSEDEELNERNGVRAQPGRKRRRNITDYQNPYAQPDFDSGMGTPDVEGSVNGDVVMDGLGEGSRAENAEIAKKKADASLAEAAAEAEAEAEDEEAQSSPETPGAADEDGDVEMEDNDDVVEHDEPPDNDDDVEDAGPAPAALTDPAPAPADASLLDSAASTAAAMDGATAPSTAASNALIEVTPPDSPIPAAASGAGVQLAADTTGVPAEDVEMAEAAGDPAVAKEAGMREREEESAVGEKAVQAAREGREGGVEGV